MSKEEFKEYLISIGGLERDYKAYKGPIIEPENFGVGEGWYSLIKELIDELIRLGWDKKISQVKEKFGGLRFYIPQDNVPEGVNECITKYETLSLYVCEKCGSTGVLRSGDWIRVLCNEHSNGLEPYDEAQRKRMFN